MRIVGESLSIRRSLFTTTKNDICLLQKRKWDLTERDIINYAARGLEARFSR